MIVLDASVLIAHLDASDVHHDRAVELLVAAVGEALAASPVTLAEVLVGPARDGRLEDALGALAVLGMREIALSADAAARLAGLRARTGLRLPDCCVLLAALDTGSGSESESGSLATFDRRLTEHARGLGLRTHGTAPEA